MGSALVPLPGNRPGRVRVLDVPRGMRILLSAILSALVCLPALPAAAQTFAMPVAKIDADVTQALAKGHIEGASIAIVRDGSVAYAKAYGLRDAAKGLAADPETVFEIGSITKQFTAVAIMQLVDAEKVSLDAPLATYLPDAPHAREVTIRELLVQTSGLPEYLDGPSIVPLAAHPASADSLIARIAKKPLDFAPGTKWEYSNTNYIVLGRVIEVASHEPYEKYMRAHVFTAAGLPHLATMAGEAAISNRSLGYSAGKPSPPLDDSWAWSAGNIVATGTELANWDVALSTGKVIPLADYSTMTSAQSPAGGTAYGFGFVIDTYDGQPRIWHNGGTFGFSSNDAYFPRQHLHIIVLTNDADAATGAIGAKIFDDLHPDLAKEELQAAPGENAALTARFKKITLALLSGHIDHSQFDAAANAKLTNDFVKQASAQLAAIGTPDRFIFKSVESRGGSFAYVYLLRTQTGLYKLTIGTDPDGKLNSIFIAPQ